MSTPTSPTNNFWRAKYARECIKKFQADQLSPYVISGPQGIEVTITPGDRPEDRELAPSDRPPLQPIYSPIPILGSGTIIGGPTEDILVGIVGAGATGLYTAMILDDLGIKYEILEGSNRSGGRILTHHFDEGTSEWNYFDIGAMRYPEIPIMWRVFKLFRDLKIDNKLVPYIMSSENQFLEYNSERVQQKKVDTSPSTDWFSDSSTIGGLVPPKFVLWGVSHWLGECFNPFRNLLAEDWNKGWTKLMEFDKYSARTFMMLPFDIPNDNGEGKFLKKEAYPNSAINWMERMNTGTGLFDMAFSEMVIDDLEFDYPNASALKWGAAAEDNGWKWYCLAGGSKVFIDAMVAKIKTKVTYNRRVISIVPTKANKPLAVTTTSGQTKETTEYSYVISTIPLPALRFVNLDRCNLSYAQREGMRTLRYDSSCKVGLRFSSRWWQTLQSGGIKGGQTKTDRIVRTVVFPSYGINDENADAVMIASYTWSQDALRIGGLCNGRDHPDEQFLIDSILGDLSALHGVTVKTLTDELKDWCAFDWYSDPFTLGAFALFGPGQFGNIYPAFDQGVAGGRLLFAGEALSEQHAWVEGALDSAYAAVHKMLIGADRPKLLEKLEANWGNPNLSKADADEENSLSRKQEIIGAILSTISDREVIKKTLEHIVLSN